MKYPRILKSSVFLTAIAVLGASYAALETEKAFSTDKFCTSCHSMSYPAAELRLSRHWGPLGVNPGCKDCHLPPQFTLRAVAHVYDGIKDIYGELKNDFSTKDKFDLKRAELAHISRVNLKKWDSSPCKACHKGVHKERGAEEEKAGPGGVTCIDCHQNLVHEGVAQEDIARGIKEGRIVLK